LASGCPSGPLGRCQRQVTAAEGKARHSPPQSPQATGIGRRSPAARRRKNGGHSSVQGGPAGWARKAAPALVAAARTWIERTSPCWIAHQWGRNNRPRMRFSIFFCCCPIGRPQRCHGCTRRATSPPDRRDHRVSWNTQILAQLLSGESKEGLGEVWTPQAPSAGTMPGHRSCCMLADHRGPQVVPRQRCDGQTQQRRIRAALTADVGRRWLALSCRIVTSKPFEAPLLQRPAG